MKASVEYLCDVLIIGSGAAGLSLALRLADQAKVLVLSKGPISEGATLYAQGGIAAVFDETDSIESHVSDTLNAGAGLCDPAVVEFTARNARDSIQWLIQQGVPFDQEEDAEGESHYHLTREGGHSHRRIFHAADATGKAVQLTLIDQVRAKQKFEEVYFKLAQIKPVLVGDPLYNKDIAQFVSKPDDPKTIYVYKNGEPVPNLPVGLEYPETPITLWSNTDAEGKVKLILQPTSKALLRTLITEQNGTGYKSQFLSVILEPQ